MTLFGPSGNSQNFFEAGNKTSDQSADWVKKMGLDAFEYPFGHGIAMGEDKAVSIGESFKKHNIAISVHAPYYINFANKDDEMIEKSISHVLKSAHMVRLMGGKRVIFHPASQGKDLRENAVSRAVENIKKLTDAIYSYGFEDLIFCPETMGKLAQIGTIEEITEICKVDKIYIPTVDFGHVNAREQGSLVDVEAYDKRIEYMIENLGMEKMKHFHIHFSKIQYSVKGEIRHLNFDDMVFGPNFEDLAISLVKHNLEPVVICESAGNQDYDAKYMKDYYFKVLKEKSL